MSSPTNRTALREEENRSAPPSRADAVDVVHQRPCALHPAGGAQQPPAQPFEMLGEYVHDGQCGVDLQPSGDRQLLLDDRFESGPVTADDPGLSGGGGALVETHGLDTLRHPVCWERKSW